MQQAILRFPAVLQARYIHLTERMLAFGPDLERTTKVGSHAPNKLGLCDMHGNVWQWCEDLYDPKASGEAASYRVYRGGRWDGDAGDCRAAGRRGIRPAGRDFSLGFRLARVPVQQNGK